MYALSRLDLPALPVNEWTYEMAEEFVYSLREAAQSDHLAAARILLAVGCHLDPAIRLLAAVRTAALLDERTRCELLAAQP